MKKINRRNSEVFSLSFLDIISCGFGAIVILLLVAKTGVSDNLLSKTKDDVIAYVEQQEILEVKLFYMLIKLQALCSEL